MSWERVGKAADLRTHILVALRSAAIFDVVLALLILTVLRGRQQHI